MADYVYINDVPRQAQENREKVNTTAVFLATVLSIYYDTEDNVFILEIDGHGRNRGVKSAPLYEDVVTYKLRGQIKSGDIVQVTMPDGNIGSRYATRMFSPRQTKFALFKAEYRNLARAMI